MLFIVCDDQPLGMEDGSIQDSFITASSWKGGQEPYKGRFNGPTGWCANLQIAGEYMQVDLTRVMTISAITMQSVQKTLLGWPYSFTIAYSYDGRVFRNYTAQDGNLKVYILLVVGLTRMHDAPHTKQEVIDQTNR